VVDAGAGPGTLARSVLSAGPDCAVALRYVLVERSAAQRSRHADHLPLEPADEAFAVVVAEDDEAPPGGIGPIAVSLAELPELPLQGVVVANELLDNLAFALCERTAGGWNEVWVAAAGGSLTEVLVPARPAVEVVAEGCAPEAEVGARVPIALGATAWLADVLDRFVAGLLVVLDYTASTPDLAARPMGEWLRTYSSHARGGPPLDWPGSQDITVEVPLDQLARVRTPDRLTSQAEFLARHGMDELVEEGRRVWDQRAATGDLSALRARSRVREAEALSDLSGLGGFSVVEWMVQGPAGSNGVTPQA
jgi:SAM-dependent MidA family methyltransferase